ncbi:MAG: RdgB/HAM1 family non-canonical purine NTP pyrophosphatase [Candidatus Saelkia tenebricola]|nr:RdgB/HAM1 family non-canonical purine NTP pyrophosphatase [Candidatus Saelkia tenebricola]
MRKLLLATFNSNKVREINQIAQDSGADFEFLYLKDFPDIKEVVEDGSSFEENAIKKAQGYYSQANIPTLAEDSGLSVVSLAGSPGIYSSRFAGEEKDDYHNNLKLLNMLKDETERDAQFICCAAVVLGPEVAKTFKGILSGNIAEEMKGNYGFGYDPVFIPFGYNQTLAEIGIKTKNKISHRKQAITLALDFLIKLSP